MLARQCLFPKSLSSSLQHGDSLVCCIEAMAWLKLAVLLCSAAEAESRISVVGPGGAEHHTHLPKGLGHQELKLLHWLPISFRIQFKALALIFKATIGGSANGIKG